MNKKEISIILPVLNEEENLKFIETLDKEARQSLKTMIAIGLDSWKNLSQKEDRKLYFDEPDEEARQQLAELHQEEGRQHQGLRHLPRLLGPTWTAEESGVQS